jgi:hypothetical protein
VYAVVRSLLWTTEIARLTVASGGNTPRTILDNPLLTAIGTPFHDARPEAGEFQRHATIEPSSPAKPATGSRSRVL